MRFRCEIGPVIQHRKSFKGIPEKGYGTWHDTITPPVGDLTLIVAR
jgi:hypothetical protein